MPGVNEEVRAFAEFDDGTGSALYVGGFFERAGGSPARGIARWDGTAWSEVGGGVVPSPSYEGVQAMTVWDDGNGPALYVGGAFTEAGGTKAWGLAKWDGNSWSEVGGGVNHGPTSPGEVHALFAYDDGTGLDLYVGGSFNNAGSLLVDNVARWDGTSWSALAGGVTWGPVRAFEEYQSLLYVGGAFFNQDDVLVWDGSSWSGTAVGSNVPAQVYDLEVYDDGSGAGPRLFVALWSVGSISSVASYDGAQWAPAGGVSGQLYGLKVFDRGNGPKLYGGGNSSTGRVLKWSGAGWSPVGGGLSTSSSVVYTFGVFDDGGGEDLYAGGLFDAAGGVSAQNVAHFDAGAWTELGPGGGLDANVHALEVFDDGSGPTLYAGGEFTGRFAGWNGGTWDTLGGGLPGTVGVPINHVLALRSFDDGTGPGLFVGGDFSAVLSGISADGLVRWTGSAWADAGGGITGGAKEVKVLEVFDDGSGPGLFVAGQFNQVGGSVSAANIARWDGAVWTPLLAGLSGGAVHSLEVWDDGGGPKLYVGGEFNNAGGAPADKIACWDGSQWTALPNVSGVGGAYAMAGFDDGSGPGLYVGGRLNMNGTHWIARWNGAWSAVGDGLDWDVFALEVYDDGGGDKLYATGRFLNTLTNKGVKKAAHWDGSTWERVGLAGLDHEGYALQAFAEPSGSWPSLWFGGKFTDASGVTSTHVARWANDCACQGIAYCTAGTSASGCTAAISSLGDASRSAATGFVVSATGVEGAKNGMFYFSTSGAQSNVWGNGTSLQCAAPPVKRTGILSGAGTAGQCDGTLQLDFNAWMSANPTSAPPPGTAAYLQGWYRDPFNTSNRTSSLSNALRVSVCP